MASNKPGQMSNVLREVQAGLINNTCLIGTSAALHPTGSEASVLLRFKLPLSSASLFHAARSLAQCSVQRLCSEVNTFSACDQFLPSHTPVHHHRLSLSLANTNTSRLAPSPHKHSGTNIQARCKSIVQRRHRAMKNACCLARFIRKTHWDSIHIAGLKTTQEYQLHRQFGRVCQWDWCWWGSAMSS